MGIYRILNKITFRRHELLIDVSDLTTMMKLLDDHNFTGRRKVIFGNCGWGKAPNCWYVIFTCNDKEWYEMLPEMKERKITLLPEYIGY